MSDLFAFQQRFAAALENPGLVLGASPRLLCALRAHRNTAMKAARDALADNYPVIRALVGEDAFAACAAAYAEANPLRDPRLCVYGAQFNTFLSDYAPFVEFSWLAGVARLEWRCIEALFAADALSVDPWSHTGGITVHTRLRLHPAVRIVACDAPVASVWLAHQPSAGSDAIQRVQWRPEIALVTRPVDKVMVGVANRGTEAFLSACMRGEPLGEAARAADEVGADIAEVFSGLIGAGAFLSHEFGEFRESL